MPKVLVIGYGNSLRGDDSVGCHVARILERHYHDDPEVRVIGSHQLTPEMAEDLSASSFVLFIDAAAGLHPGKIETTAITARPGPASFAHHLDPASLLSAAMELYGSVPRAQLLTIVGASFEMGDRFSPVIAAGIPDLLNAAKDVVSDWVGQCAGALARTHS